MNLHGWLTTGEILEIFAEEIAEVGGKVSDTFDDGAHLFTRSILPGEREIQAGDRVQGGVALRATEQAIWVHPYVFRQVCRNGSIRAQAIETRHILRADLREEDDPEVAYLVREAVRASCDENTFRHSVEEMGSAREMEVDVALTMMSMISQLPRHVGEELFKTVMARLIEGQDQSRFGLMNAVTSVARDTRDPALRWRLEEFGGGIPANVQAPEPRPGRPIARARGVLVG